MTFLHQPRDFSQKSFGSLPLLLNWPGLCHMSIPKPISGKRKACRVIGFTPEVVAGSAFPGECWGDEPNQNRGSLCKREGGNCLCLLPWPPLGGYKGTSWHPCDSVHHDCGHDCCPLSLVLLMGMEPSSKTLLLFTKNQGIFCHEGSSPGHLVFHLPSSRPQFMKYSLLLTQGGQGHLCREWLLVQHVWRTRKSHISELNTTMPCLCPVTLPPAPSHWTCATSLLPTAYRWANCGQEWLCWLLVGQHRPGLWAQGSSCHPTPWLLLQMKLTLQVPRCVWLQPFPERTFWRLPAFFDLSWGRMWSPTESKGNTVCHTRPWHC